MELDEILIECPICDRSIPATSKKCQFCGTELSMSGLDELEELALHVDDFYPESPLQVAVESEEELETSPDEVEKIPEEAEPVEEESEDQEQDSESITEPEEFEEDPDKPMPLAEMEQHRKDRKKEKKIKKVTLKAEKKEKKSLRRQEKREKKLNRRGAKRDVKDGGTTEKGSH